LSRLACLDDRDALALVAGTLAAERLPDALAHVETCVDCRELIEGLCAGDEPPPPPSGIDARVGSEHGPYAITALIAAGGMGRVYRATDRVRGREVALKIPRSRSPWLVRRFEREIGITARLGHPGVVPLHDSGTLGDGTPFYVMQLVEGISLERAIGQAVNREQRLALVGHLVAVATTMAFVHDRGIAHRDLKPHNVLVGAFGEVVILDWGLAKELDATASVRRVLRVEPVAAPLPPITGRTTRPGDVLGTPAFMAPEQARGEDVDQRADVYALGAMLEQLLVGFLPRKAADAALALAPAALVSVSKRALAPERDDRHAHAGEFASELRAAVATPAAPPPAPSPWRRILGQS